MAQANIRAVITAEDRASSSLKGFAGRVEKLGDSIARTAKRASLALGAAAIGAATFGVKTAADFETARSALIGLLGSAKEADKTMARIKKEAAATPFELTGLTEGVKQLSAVTKTGDEAIDILLNVGKAITASGGGQFELDRVVFNLKQIKGIGKLDAIDLKELRRAIPIFDKLVEAAGTSVEEIRAAKDPAKALFDVFEKGGKKLEAVDKAFINQGGNFNQILSNMKDSFAIFTSDFVKATGIFDLAKKALKGVTDVMANNKDSLINGFNNFTTLVRDGVIPQLKQWLRVLGEVGAKIAEYLSPKLEALWNTLTQSLIPALAKFWKEVIVPMIPVIGTALVVALGLAIDALNLLAKIVVPLTEFLADHKEIVWLLVGAYTAWKGSLMITGAIKAAQGAIAKLGSGMGAATLKAVGFRKVLTSMYLPGGTLALFAGAAIVVVNQVLKKFKAMHEAAQDAASALASLDVSNDMAVRRMQKEATKARNRGDTEGAARIARQIEAVASQRAVGGPVSAGAPYIVGEKGPELFVPNNSGNIVPNNKMGGGSVNITLNGPFMGSEVEARKFANKILVYLKDIAGSKGMTLTEMMGR